MRRRLFSVGPTAFYVHAGAVLLWGYMLWAGKGRSLAAATVSILLHEGAHALLSALFGHPPKEIELTPLGALMRLEDDAALSAPKRLCVLAAGPAVSLLLCRISILLVKNGIFSIELGRCSFLTNLLLTLFNLFPALPLDGGRLLALLLSWRLSNTQVSSILRISGTCCGLVLIAADMMLCFRLGTWNLSLCMAGCMLMYSACRCTQTRAMDELRALLDRRIFFEKKSAISCRTVAVRPSLPVRLALEKIPPGQYAVFCLLDAGNRVASGLIGEQALVDAYLRTPKATCGEILAAHQPQSPEMHGIR